MLDVLQILDARHFRLKSDEGWRRHWFHTISILQPFARAFWRDILRPFEASRSFPLPDMFWSGAFVTYLSFFFAPKRALMLLQIKLRSVSFQPCTKVFVTFNFDSNCCGVLFRCREPTAMAYMEARKDLHYSLTFMLASGYLAWEQNIKRGLGTEKFSGEENDGSKKCSRPLFAL